MPCSTIFIGVDYGTTFSGAALVFDGSPKEIDVITEWPGKSNTTTQKCPSLLSYKPAASSTNGLPSTSNRVVDLFEASASKRPLQPIATDIKWGCHVEPGDDTIRCLKLFLDRDQKLPGWIDDLNTAAILKRNNRTPQEATADYLAQIHLKILDHLKTRYTKDFLESVTLKYILTVPAVWSNLARERTLAAAKHAGMGPDVSMISEPEAAAYYALRIDRSQQFKVGDNIVVCDAGGGTVDLISYTLTHVSPPTIKECAVGTGDVCGAANINMRFEEHVRNRLGSERFNNFKTTKAKHWNLALKHFEEGPKRLLSTTSEEEYSIPWPGAPDDEEAGVQDGFLILTAANLREIYDPVIDRVLSLIDGQVSTIHENEQSVAAILLVGGFGPIAVLQPLNGWTAVAQGAALRGVDGTLVSSRKSRFNYGTSVSTNYIAGRHPTSSKYFDAYHGIFRVKHEMHWHVLRDQDVSEKRATKLHLRHHWQQVAFPSASDLQHSSRLLANADAKAPLMKDMGLVKTICTMESDLTKVPCSLFEKKTGANGKPFWEISYDLEMRIDSARLEFSMLVGGKEYGSVKAEFE